MVTEMIKKHVQAAAWLLILSCTAAHSQESGLVGEWTFVATGFDSLRGGTNYINVSIEENNGQLQAYAYNGPAPLRVNGNDFELDLDWHSGFDLEHLATFKGHLKEDGTIAGEMSNNGENNFLGRPMRDGQFTATRAKSAADLEGLAPEPVDFTGIWNRAFGLGAVRKIQFATTKRGQDIIDNYLEMDNANSRCASPGLVLASGLPYPMEILHTENYIVIVYAADYVRRIYLDGREFPDSGTNSSFGFSSGEWKGETLVVTTTMLNPAYMSTRGQPVSADAYTIEHFYFDDKGYLHGDMWLHDPANYTRPPYLRRVYDRDFSPSVITKVDCDPYSFFRALYLEGELETLWQRARYRR
jgi:hypothetical protein